MTHPTRFTHDSRYCCVGSRHLVCPTVILYPWFVASRARFSVKMQLIHVSVFLSSVHQSDILERQKTSQWTHLQFKKRKTIFADGWNHCVLWQNAGRGFPTVLLVVTPSIRCPSFFTRRKWKIDFTKHLKLVG